MTEFDQEGFREALDYATKKEPTNAAEFGLRYDMAALKRTAEEMFASLPAYRRREIYEYINRMEQLTRLLRADADRWGMEAARKNHEVNHLIESERRLLQRIENALNLLSIYEEQNQLREAEPGDYRYMMREELTVTPAPDQFPFDYTVSVAPKKDA